LKWVFQKDNDPKHTTQSLDLNPIENLWGDIKNAVSENVVQSSWAGIPVHRCQKSCNKNVLLHVGRRYK
uniref:Tc1-like transposase DDE domain-containing protein n=1 Tax=Paramormyrops kingsleyae TaxID=1676925 RepID=A0A3B3RXM4_9TELE